MTVRAGLVTQPSHDLAGVEVAPVPLHPERLGRRSLRPRGRVRWAAAGSLLTFQPQWSAAVVCEAVALAPSATERAAATLGNAYRPRATRMSAARGQRGGDAAARHGSPQLAPRAGPTVLGEQRGEVHGASRARRGRCRRCSSSTGTRTATNACAGRSRRACRRPRPRFVAVRRPGPEEVCRSAGAGAHAGCRCAAGRDPGGQGLGRRARPRARPRAGPALKASPQPVASTLADVRGLAETSTPSATHRAPAAPKVATTCRVWRRIASRPPRVATSFSLGSSRSTPSTHDRKVSTPSRRMSDGDWGSTDVVQPSDARLPQRLEARRPRAGVEEHVARQVQVGDAARPADPATRARRRPRRRPCWPRGRETSSGRRARRAG